MMLRLDWEEEAKIAVAAQLAAKATEEEVTDDAGGDIFLSEPLSSPHSQPHTPQHHSKLYLATSSEQSQQL
jgi:hypothetical protein